MPRRRRSTPRTSTNLRPAFVFQTEVLESMETVADRRRRRHVPDDVVQPRLRDRRGDRRGILALQAQDGRRSRRSAAGPTTAASRSWAASSIMGTLDAKLVALDAKTGQVCCGRRRSPIRRRATRKRWRRSFVDGKVLIGTNGGEYGIRGFVKAYNAADGKLLWTFYTIPDKGQEGVWAANDATGRDMHRDIAGREGRAGEGRRFLPDAGRRRVDDARDRPQDAHGLLRRRQSVARPLRRDPSGRQPVHRLDRRRRPRHGRVQVALPVHRRTTSGTSTRSARRS